MGFYLVLVTALILCLGINDEQLLIGTAPVPMPFLNVTLPIWAFASVVPLLVMVVHFDLLHNLNEHNRKLRAWVAAWEAKYPPAGNPAAGEREMAVSDQLFPFLYDFAWLHANGRGPQNINAKLLPGMCWALYCWAPYTVLVIFLIRFADLQSYFFTAWHLVLILLDVVWLVFYWPRLGVPQVGFWRRMRKVFSLRVMLLGVSSLAGCWTLWLYGLIQMHLDFDGSPDRVKAIIKLENKIQPVFGITIVPRLTVPNYRVKLEPNHFQLAKVLAPEKSDGQLWPDTAPPLDLSGRRFGFADFSNAVMPRVNFDNAKMKAIRLYKAQLHGASLVGAHLQESYLSDAQLRGADLSAAQLQGASLPYAQLQGSNLYSAHLQRAHLHATHLQGAKLKSARLQGASLSFTQLQGADLENTQLQGADLSNSVIVGSVLNKTQLRGIQGPDLAQFSATSGAPDWKTTGSLLTMLGAPWVKPLNANSYAVLKIQLTIAEARQKNFTPPTLPAQDSQKFAQAWLTTACQEEAIAKAMIKHSGGHRLHTAITDADLRKWIQTHEECKPYQALAEKAIKDRADTNP